MRTQLTGLTMVLALTGFLGGVALAQDKGEKQGPEDRISVLSVAPEGETEDARKLRVRALKIELERELKRVKSMEKKSDTPAEREARKELEDEAKKAEKAEKRTAKAIQSLHVVGCDDPLTYVNPKLCTSFGMRYSYNQSMVNLTIFNKEEVPISIRSTFHGVLLQGLCPGGSVDITLSARWGYANSTQIEFVAFASVPGGMTLTERRSINLNKAYDWHSRQTNADTWEVRLR